MDRSLENIPRNFLNIDFSLTSNRNPSPTAHERAPQSGLQQAGSGRARFRTKGWMERRKPSAAWILPTDPETVALNRCVSRIITASPANRRSEEHTPA